MKIKRLLAMLIDYIVAIIISMIVTAVAFRGQLLAKMDFYMWFAWLLFTIKDIEFRNYSIGKKKFELEIRTEKNEIPNLLVITSRNLFLILLPIEIILILIYNKRLGDIVFRTKVVDRSLIKS